ncbi:hypothetical protein SLEP1_g27461 [Rubroshorea leprosula]|uniref:Uncharacterized protein n=1 Tax=Rubroshorea leprosula TaxID=152421 RepID=A0AAV5JWZ3_9ROSI|nr:hypothetical protein SLEP1_g27461 [Rubroshorea leprosula]
MHSVKHNGEGHIAVDMEKLVSSYKSDQSKSDQSKSDQSKSDQSREFCLSRESCIFKIPSILSRHNPKAYSPNAFSFGPWHHDDDHLKLTHALKINYLKDLLHPFPDREAKLLDLEAAVTEMEEKVRQCYAEQISFHDDRKFARILLLDGCFIIALFLKSAKVISRDPDDPIFGMACMLQFLYHDLILLENQIPWFVLERIFDLTKESIKQSADIELHQLAIQFFGNIFTSGRPPPEVKDSDTDKIKHIIDLLRTYLFLPYLKNTCQKQPSEQQNSSPQKTTINEERESHKHLPSASRLTEAGVKFKRSNDSIFHIRFCKGVLEVPSILIHNTTETIFRNLIAYEQCYYHLEPIVTSYAKLMDNLIDKVDDLHILCKRGIISNSMSSEDATQLFNKLYNDARIPRSHCSEIYEEVNSYCRRGWPRWRAAYTQNYFTKPWAIVSQLFAIMILTLTLLQVVPTFLLK